MLLELATYRSYFRSSESMVEDWSMPPNLAQTTSI